MNNILYKDISFRKEISYKKNCIGEVHLLEIQHIPIHLHDDMELIYVLTGCAEIKISFNVYNLKKSDFFMINAHEVHEIKGFEHCEILLVHIRQGIFQYEKFVFDPEFFRKFYRDIVSKLKEQMKEIYFLSQTFENVEQMNRRYEVIANLCDSYFQMQFFNLTKRSLGDFYNHETNNERMRKIYEYLYDHYNEKIMLTDLAEDIHVDKFYISHLIKEGIGENFQNILNIIRVDRAEVFLLGTTLKIQQVGETVGFSSYSSFVKRFKEFFSMTPSQYRKKYQKEIYPMKKVKAKEYTYSRKKLDMILTKEDVGKSELYMELEECVLSIKQSIDCFGQYEDEQMKVVKDEVSTKIIFKKNGWEIILKMESQDLEGN